MDKTEMTKKVEAYGVKGMKSTPWRKTFRDTVTMLAWVEKHNAEITNWRFVEN
jgi:hypothetical protein